MELLRLKCPVCHSADIQYHSTYTTKNHGGRVIYKCDTCPVYFSETKKTLMEGLKTPVSVIWQVLKARTEGMGLNAAARTFEKAKNTILAWERKCIDLHQVLFLYALVHEFLELVIEGMKRIQRYRRMSLPISHLGGPYYSWIEPVGSFGSSIVERRIENSFKRRSSRWTVLQDIPMISVSLRMVSAVMAICSLRYVMNW